MSRLSLPSAELEADRDPGAICSFRRSDGRSRTWSDFASSVAAARALIRERSAASWILYCDDCYAFDVAFTALVREGARILLPGGVQPGLIAAIRGHDCALIGDGAFDASSGSSEDIRTIVDASAASAAGSLPLGASRAGEASITFFTSGSTGQPKAVPKRLAQIEAEITNLHELWGADIEGRIVFSTVSQQHIYGFLFFGLLPICSGAIFCSERLAYPESLAALEKEPSALVASPAFLKRAVEADIASLPPERAAVSFSSGGLLPDAVARTAGRIFGAVPMEIYGSSETGGVAYRRAASGMPWRAFKGVDLRIGEGGRIEVRSPYLAETGFIVTDDLGEIDSDGSLALLGRADSVVKIEEKRVSLVEIEARLRDSLLVSDVHALALETAGRQAIGVAVVLSDAGRVELARSGRRAVTGALRSLLGEYFAPVLLPRKWRYLATMPLNEQGKLRKDIVLALFEGPEPPYDLVSRTASEDRVDFVLSFPPDCRYFEGHFPSYAILPAVAQIDIAIRIAVEDIGASKKILSMPRVKFQKPIVPSRKYTLGVSYDSLRGRIEFAFTETDTGEPCSSGKINLRTCP
jgi:acyl-coenzyme A synthetase/AMP-(fatty) acid ligase